jgi:hypothetical protein
MGLLGHWHSPPCCHTPTSFDMWIVGSILAATQALAQLLNLLICQDSLDIGLSGIFGKFSTCWLTLYRTPPVYMISGRD